MQRDGQIRVLPIHVANKIAAGEVVERPASALKELVENAIDAGADRIDISITAGGRKLVSVRDNGCGMNRDNALLSLERQATSKIRDVDDIENIDTLGFRGEAIPSIASVSRFTIITRRKESDAATKLVVNAGTIAEVSECGAPPGTCVEVRDLFCNVPARRKFLRSYATEEGHIKSVFTVSALAHPELGFSLTVDGREVHRLAPGSTIEERISSLFGRDFSDELIPVKDGAEDGSQSAGGIRVYGYISRPSSNPVRREQFIFVNGRPATAPTIAYALKDAYPTGRNESKPSIFLFIEVPPSEVDVNVHPAKREVRFRRPADVKAAIIEALSNALRGRQAAQPCQLEVSAPVLPPPTPSPHDETPTPLPVKTAFTVPFQPTPAPIQRPLPILHTQQAPDPYPTGKADCPQPTTPISNSNPQLTPTNSQLTTHNSQLSSSSGPWKFFKVLACTDSGYLLIETDAGIVTLNPQAAQERIAFEKLMSAFDSGSDTTGMTASQPLLIPETVHFSPLESARLKNFKHILVKQGFEIDEFGPDTWKIDAMPALISGQSAADIIASIVYDIGEAGVKRGERWREELIAKSVARSFAGAPRKFTIEDASRLVEELGRTSMPYVCPRGKPVMIFTSNRELTRKFGG
ncbi:MAG: DNA mismatch repair endonuclease MutL [Kiritimatiellae bacterium]|nr:DNA mismatch repair endonuclease MutL [Kiritimatiellia bacterium]